MSKNLFLPNVFQYGTLLLLTTAVLFFVGWGMIRLMPRWQDKGNSFLTFFNATVIGLTVVLPLFAVIWARGNSIMWIAVLLWIGFLWVSRKDTARNHSCNQLTTQSINQSRTAVILSIVILLGSFAAFYYLFFVRSGSVLYSDHVFYANASCVMMQEHTETASFASLFRIPAPYHYGDLWFTAFCSFVFRLKPLYVLLLITYPFLCFLVVVGMAALCKEIAKLPDWTALVHGIAFLFFIPLVSIVIPWIRPILSSPKGFVVTLFGIWGLLMLIKKDYLRAFVTFCFLIPFYSTVAPGVLTFVFFMGIVLKWKQTRKWNSLLNGYSIASVGVALAFGFFYFLQKKSPIEEPVRFLYEGNWMVNALFFAVKRFLRAIILLLPTMLVLTYWGKRKKKKRNLWYLMASFLISCAVSCIVGGLMREVNRDGGQITTNYVDTIITIICYCLMVFAVYKVVEKIKFIPKQAVCLLFLLYFVFTPCISGNNNYIKSEPYYGIEKSGLLQFAGEEASFAIIGDKGFEMMPHLLKSGYFSPYNFSELDIPVDFPKIFDDSHSHAFWQYVCLQKHNGTFVSNEQSMLDFAKEMGVDYIIVNYGTTISDVFENRVERVLVYDGDTLYHCL